ncbi:hypothetical protein [Staphylococcus auricularis]|uniref:hypothetical protein n=1 Tax=Staphylococcus auricularis TaxID=29379 RepID=UPI00242E97C6|nr:hypothetical protein [Staphylococcus auricularis]
MEKQEKRKHRQLTLHERWREDGEEIKKRNNYTKEETDRIINDFIMELKNDTKK